ncbi:GGDEF domain-containing protein [Devosia sp.]|uniref:GGDEF domain-containing protein n=1 Tax=Devosia sp. TaxID=1871048 RepID=UPI001AC3ECA5|nr:GGDEF domain-containing protein [Devosia sp.]MBN9335670.1 GGDEF domain-containing protein [Devosia sp.]
MPHLDFMTLYILIFLNSLTVAAIWAGFAYTYRPHAAAQHWLVATLLTLIGGIVLAVQGNEGSVVPAILGNTIIILGFSQFWIGLRRLRNLRGGQGMAVAFTLLAAAVMVALYDSDRGRAITYAAGQAIIMLTCLVHLLRNRLPGIGTIISATAFAIAMLGQIMVVTSNVAVLADALDYEVYYALASYALLCTVFSAAIWNLGFAMMAIDGLHQKLTHLSETDDLTGLANRRAFRTALEDMQQRALGGVYTYSVVLIDLNDFKPLNDRFGHAAGDAALQFFAQLLRASTRKGDVVARLGGDEFCILLPDSTASDARTVADVVRHKTSTESLLLPEASVRLSASIGVAGTPEDGQVDLVALADTRLYRDKKQTGSPSRSEPSRLQLITKR